MITLSAEGSLRMGVGVRRAGETGRGSVDAQETKTPIPKIAAPVEDPQSQTPLDINLRGRDDVDGGRVSTVDVLTVDCSDNASLGEVGERLVLTFLPFVPDRLHVEAVCRRWRRVSQHNVPITTLDFDGVKVPKQHDLLRLLERADGALRQLVLPDVRIGDALVQIIQSQSELRALRAYRCGEELLSGQCIMVWGPITDVILPTGCKRSTSS